MILRAFVAATFGLLLVSAHPGTAGEPASSVLPNLSLTPGATRGLSLEQICNTKWGKDVRHVDTALKKKVFTEYGFPKGNKDSRCPCEVDHLVSRELGGADTLQNLWVQSYSGPWNAHQKDRVENRLHKEVCAGHMSLQDAQQGIVRDWTALYKKFFSE